MGRLVTLIKKELSESLSHCIKIETIEGRKLTFHNVLEYTKENGMLIFTDSLTQKQKEFSTAHKIEITEEK